MLRTPISSGVPANRLNPQPRSGKANAMCRLASYPLIVAMISTLVLSLGTPTLASGADTGATRPRMIDFGSDKCNNCKKMAPMIEELRQDYAGVVDVVFIDVRKAPAAGRQHKIRLMPTQIFFDAAGQEVLRHEGLYSRAEIEKVFKEKLGVAPIPAGSAKEGKRDSSGVVAPDRRDDRRGSSLSLLVGGTSSSVLRPWLEESH